MTNQQQWHPPGPHPTLDQALDKILSEIQAGLEHGFFHFALTCDIVSSGRRRLTLRAGKNHQFLIPREACVRPTSSPTPDTGAAPTINDPRTIVTTTSTRLTPLDTEPAVTAAYGDPS
jgi:hypothetical protein